jgi:cytochrome c553
MSITRNWIAICATGLLFATGSAYARGDFEAGKAKVTAVCAACHGLDGNGKTDTDARLAGQYADYIVKALEDYANGGRNNPIMMGIASTLTPADRANVAAYFAAMEGGVETVQSYK